MNENMEQRTPVVLTKDDVMKRYCCGVNTARTIIQSVRACCGGGKLPRGKILASELAYWESMPIKRQVRI